MLFVATLMVIIETTNSALDPIKVAEFWKERSIKLQHDLRLREKQLSRHAALEESHENQVEAGKDAARIKELSKELKAANKELAGARGYVSGRLMR